MSRVVLSYLRGSIGPAPPPQVLALPLQVLPLQVLALPPQAPLLRVLPLGEQLQVVVEGAVEARLKAQCNFLWMLLQIHLA